MMLAMKAARPSAVIAAIRLPDPSLLPGRVSRTSIFLRYGYGNSNDKADGYLE